jgi:hypothetical protein
MGLCGPPGRLLSRPYGAMPSCSHSPTVCRGGSFQLRQPFTLLTRFYRPFCGFSFEKVIYLRLSNPHVRVSSIASKAYEPPQFPADWVDARRRVCDLWRPVRYCCKQIRNTIVVRPSYLSARLRRGATSTPRSDSHAVFVRRFGGGTYTRKTSPGLFLCISRMTGRYAGIRLACIMTALR